MQQKHLDSRRKKLKNLQYSQKIVQNMLSTSYKICELIQVYRNLAAHRDSPGQRIAMKESSSLVS